MMLIIMFSKGLEALLQLIHIEKINLDPFNKFTYQNILSIAYFIRN